MLTQTRAALVEQITAKLDANRESLRRMWAESAPVRHCWLDDLLDEETAREISRHFPPPSSLMLRSSLRERKRVGVEVDSYAPIVGDALYAFQDEAVIEAVRQITGHRALLGDPSLYAAGLSVMGQGDFLNPHIDNSHDGDRRHYRALNLLYYLSPEWKLENGGNLELWDTRVRTATTLLSQFNRLVVMETDTRSWHSVKQVNVSQPRYCVSNYYFSPDPPGGRPYRHVTTFTGRPEEPVKRAVLAVVDRVALNAAGRLLPQLTRRTRHRRRPGA